LNDAGAGFRSETNKITMIDKNDVVRKGDLKSKKEVAADIFNEIMKSFEA
jgi:phosphopantothenoylcysteine decarboxylase/phosphopantothenate--cysteine ligase